MPAGRPTKYEPEWMLNKVIEVSTKGGTIAEVCVALSIHYDTYYEWEKKLPEFSITTKKGRVLAEEWWMGEGKEMMRTRNSQPSIWIFMMKNMFHLQDNPGDNSDKTVNVNLNYNLDEPPKKPETSNTESPRCARTIPSTSASP